MHYHHIVALSGDIVPEDLRECLDAIMDRFDENREVPLHRDESVYAQDREATLRQARKANGDTNECGYDTLDDDAILESWNGQTIWDTDGWPLTTRNPDSQWDWWVIGGRWGGALVLREGAQDGPLSTEDHALGRREEADLPNHTDCARWCDLMPESVDIPYSWLDLDGQWHTRWIGPTHEEAVAHRMPKDTSHWEVPRSEHETKFMKFLADLPSDTWLVSIDYHN